MNSSGSQKIADLFKRVQLVVGKVLIIKILRHRSALDFDRQFRWQHVFLVKDFPFKIQAASKSLICD
jgi:hypothetical protein